MDIFDHIGALKEIRDDYDVKVYIHQADAEMLTDSQKNLSAYLYYIQVAGAGADDTLADGQILETCGLNLTVLHTPGHSPGSVVLLSDGLAFTGDTLFYRSVGRTDFYGCDAAAMKASLEKIKKAIPSNYQLFPGHGQQSVMADELKENIYLN